MYLEEVVVLQQNEIDESFMGEDSSLKRLV